jgi:hypothetical protein
MPTVRSPPLLQAGILRPRQHHGSPAVAMYQPLRPRGHRFCLISPVLPARWLTLRLPTKGRELMPPSTTLRAVWQKDGAAAPFTNIGSRGCHPCPPPGRSRKRKLRHRRKRLPEVRHRPTRCRRPLRDMRRRLREQGRHPRRQLSPHKLCCLLPNAPCQATVPWDRRTILPRLLAPRPSPLEPCMATEVRSPSSQFLVRPP